VSAGVVPEAELPAHLEQVKLRLESGEDGLRERAAALESLAPRNHRERLLEQAFQSKAAGQRIHWLRQEANLVVRAAAGRSACKRGCSSCCHIGTSVAEPEAIVIGKAIGRTPASLGIDRFVRPANAQAAGQPSQTLFEIRSRIDADFLGVPCSFLVDNECSIYEHRPLACRQLINIDVDSLLCRLVPGATIKAPYVDMGRQQLAYAVAMGMNARIADIRDWFPRPLTPLPGSDAL
jgi:Fe-S-cluster containining protein